MNMIANVGICLVPLIVLTAAMLLCSKRLSAGSVLLSILSGFLAVIPIAVIQLLITALPFFSSGTIAVIFLTSIVFNGLIEETIKMFLLMMIPGKKQGPATFTMCSLIAGFSIGVFETIIYYIFYGTDPLSYRYITTVLIHAFCSGLSGLYVWSFKQKVQYVRPFLSSIFIHGLYNFFAGFVFPLKIFSFVTILYAAIRLKFSYDRLTNKKDNDTLPTNYDAG